MVCQSIINKKLLMFKFTNLDSEILKYYFVLEITSITKYILQIW
jgi:hypothetical protein